MRENSARSIERHAVAVRASREEDDDVDVGAVFDGLEADVGVLLPEVEGFAKRDVNNGWRQVRRVLRDRVCQEFFVPLS